MCKNLTERICKYEILYILMNTIGKPHDAQSMRCVVFLIILDKGLVHLVWSHLEPVVQLTATLLENKKVIMQKQMIIFY